MPLSLYWHDYETFGADPMRDRPAQFAGLRTDEDLNVVGDPLVIYCRPADDRLPRPEACLVTGITPQTAAREGVAEAEFIARIHGELARPGTCGVGYNTLRFDDELTRFTLYRNFFDPYGREWQNGNSRWDLIDLARMAYALRPDGIEWPRHGDGKPSFRLEHLAAANGIGHEAAHDALSDVHATIGLARLIRARQPRLYDWLFQLRRKDKALELLDLRSRGPVVHTTRRYPAEQGCTSLVMPLVAEKGNRNGVLVYDLRVDPEPFLGLGVERLRECLFGQGGDLPEGAGRLPVKAVRANKCPALAPRSTLDERAVERIAIDLAACERHWRKLMAADDFALRVADAYAGEGFGPAEDVDVALYDGFFHDADRRLMEQVRQASPEELAGGRFLFRDPRLPELLFRYRARNWPESLNGEERARWLEYRRWWLREAGEPTLDAFFEEVDRLREGETDARRLAILDELREYGEALAADL